MLRLIQASSIPQDVSINDIEQALEAVIISVPTSLQGQVSVAFVPEAEARALNKQFADNDYPTDVLSFNYFENDEREPTEQDVVGEIVICTPVAETQALEYGTSLHNEFLMLFVHGLLHILGHDHIGTQQASFETLQNGIMDKLQIHTRSIFDGHSH